MKQALVDLNAIGQHCTCHWSVQIPWNSWQNTHDEP